MKNKEILNLLVERELKRRERKEKRKRVWKFLDGYIFPPIAACILVFILIVTLSIILISLGWYLLEKDKHIIKLIRHELYLKNANTTGQIFEYTFPQYHIMTNDIKTNYTLELRDKSFYWYTNGYITNYIK